VLTASPKPPLRTKISRFWIQSIDDMDGKETSEQCYFVVKGSIQVNQLTKKG